MRRYRFDQSGYYAGVVTTDNPALIPARTTDAAPPRVSEGEFAVWTGDGWRVTTKKPPNYYGTIPTGDFAQLFTQPQRTQLRTSNDPVIDDFVYLLEREDEINLDSPKIQQAFDYFAQSPDTPSFTEAEAERILRREPPE